MFRFLRQSPPHLGDRAKPARTRLSLEMLERRDTPADLSLTVDTLSDVVNGSDGVLSLREALALTNGTSPTTLHTISFASGIAGGTITLSDASGYEQLQITEKVIINGPTGSSITVRRDPQSTVNFRIFDILDTTATLRRLVIRNGSVSGTWGGILSRGSDLTVDQCTVTANTAGHGGGIGCTSTGNYTGSLLMYDSTVSSNTATSYGGGVYIGPKLTAGIYDTRITGNTSSGSGGGIAIFHAISMPDVTTVTLSGVEVDDNTAATSGGGIFVERQLDETEGSVSLTITGDSEIHDNEVTSTGGKGGGIFFGCGTITLDGVTIADNDADSGDGMYRVTGTTLNAPDVTYTNDSATVGS